MKRYIIGVLVLARAYILRFFRDKTAIFFTFLFPLLFLFVFGSINSGNSDISFKIALLNHSSTSFAQTFDTQLRENETFEVVGGVTDFEDARERMGRGEIDTIIELPDTFGALNDKQQPSGALNVYYSEASPQSGQAVAAVMEGALDGINRELGQPEPPLTVVQKSTATANLSTFDYVFAGLLGFTLLSIGIFGLANQMPAEKKTGAFRRLRASPITAGQLVFANMIYYLLVGLISVVLMFVVAYFIFGFEMRGSWFSLVPFIILGIVSMFGFGLAIGGWAKNENQSAALTNIVALPMMFLSGVFFPRFLMPEWLQGITGYLPLTPIVDGLRMIMTEGKTLLDLGPELAIIGVWTVVVYVVAIRVFRWE
ncbi:MAG: ABC transporter permease [Candidatus Microsaccharimonas sp.]